MNWLHYSSEGYALEHLRDAVNQMKIDTSAIRKPFGASPAKGKRPAPLRLVSG